MSVNFYKIPASSNDANFHEDAAEYLDPEYAAGASYALFGDGEQCGGGNYASAVETRKIGMNPNYIAAFMVTGFYLPGEDTDNLFWIIAVNRDEDKVIGAERIEV